MNEEINPERGISLGSLQTLMSLTYNIASQKIPELSILSVELIEAILVQLSPAQILAIKNYLGARATLDIQKLQKAIEFFIKLETLKAKISSLDS